MFLRSEFETAIGRGHLFNNWTPDICLAVAKGTKGKLLQMNSGKLSLRLRMDLPTMTWTGIGWFVVQKVMHMSWQVVISAMAWSTLNA